MLPPVDVAEALAAFEAGPTEEPLDALFAPWCALLVLAIVALDEAPPLPLLGQSGSQSPAPVAPVAHAPRLMRSAASTTSAQVKKDATDDIFHPRDEVFWLSTTEPGGRAKGRA